MRKKILAVLLVLTLVLTALAGCGGDNKDAQGDKDGYRVAYIARAQSDSFAAWLANEMKAEADNYDDITLDVIDGQADDEKENAAIENAIANGYDAIIVQPNNGEAQRPYVEQIVSAGIIAITTNARIDGIEGASSVDADPYVQAKVNAEAAIKQVPKNGKVVVLKGPSGNFHADERLKAWKEVFFSARPDVKILAEDFANWNKDEAMQLMEDWIMAHGEIDAIISMNDNMAAGALEAVKGKAEYADILSYGVDGTAEACLLIEEGKMTSTCLQSAIDLAKLNMETVHKLLTGEETQIDTDIAAPLITKDNASEYVNIYKERGLITE
ncbi:sugar ABC transporter substrate-binding protein [Sinanaerobacter sp. ZZT-01]|uniref:sugar ABC transporter substrate-binding protein n=1 Tax=Sinanaerobacter sp. ZZT-01 TaxID=3111540 RepID=UPI002D787C00|nr:sugar ABC transporter substrate-binding protein [Sinanaerobacter sp. ZZT-01]WRR94523.1 sugar ABC transporter substrate-binding protein [Sinanaerobacter sp. ZZT-01]